MLNEIMLNLLVWILCFFSIFLIENFLFVDLMKRLRVKLVLVRNVIDVV